MLCAFNRHDTLEFCFQLYDADDDKNMKYDEYKNMLFELSSVGDISKSKKFETTGDRRASGAFQYSNEMQTGLQLFNEYGGESKDGGGQALDHDSFERLAGAAPRVFFPVFRLQFSIQKSTLGPKRWGTVIAAVEKQRNKVMKEIKKMEDKRKRGGEVTDDEIRLLQQQKVFLS
jgi:hypothetical protein